MANQASYNDEPDMEPTSRIPDMSRADPANMSDDTCEPDMEPYFDIGKGTQNVNGTLQALGAGQPYLRKN